MQSQKNITQTYDKVAVTYAKKLINELDEKPLDRLLLKAFADENKDKGTILDIACGPGQTTKFLADSGVTDIIGTDISPAMIAAAKKINPELHFEVADVLNLQYQTASIGAALAFYGIVNFDYTTIKAAFKEIKRVLKPGAQFLFSFHIGDDKVHLDELMEQKVDIDFYFLEVDTILILLNEVGFKPLDVIKRFPYQEEYQSKRAYIRVQKIS